MHLKLLSRTINILNLKCGIEARKAKRRYLLSLTSSVPLISPHVWSGAWLKDANTNHDSTKVGDVTLFKVFGYSLTMKPGSNFSHIELCNTASDKKLGNRLWLNYIFKTVSFLNFFSQKFLFCMCKIINV